MSITSRYFLVLIDVKSMDVRGKFLSFNILIIDINPWKYIFQSWQMEEDSPEAKRLKVVTGHEVLAMLRKHENDVIFLSFCFSVFLSRHHSDQMSEGSQVSKVSLCVKILKWHPPTDSVSQWPRSGIELPGQLKHNIFGWFFGFFSELVSLIELILF